MFSQNFTYSNSSLPVGCLDSYPYGFNGKEKDDEVKGIDDSYDYGFRIYDPRIGKFLSIDPIANTYPYYSPYHFAGNKPILAKDLDGREDDVQTKKFSDFVTVDPLLQPGTAPKVIEKSQVKSGEYTKAEFKQSKAEWKSYQAKVDKYNYFSSIVKSFENAPAGSIQAEQREQVIKNGKNIVLTDRKATGSELGSTIAVTNGQENQTTANGPDSYIITLDYHQIINNNGAYGSEATQKLDRENNTLGHINAPIVPTGKGIAVHEFGHYIFDFQHATEMFNALKSNDKTKTDELNKQSENAAQDAEYKYYKTNKNAP